MAHAVGMPHVERSPRLDLWFAVAAGPGPWLDAEILDPIDRLVVAGGVASALALSLSITATAAASLQFRSWTGAAFVEVILLVLLAVLSGAGMRLRGMGPTAVVLARAAAALGILAVTVKVYGSVAPVLLSSFGVAAGAEATVTLRGIGANVTWSDLLRRFLLSSVHAGVLTGAVLLALLPATRPLRADEVRLGLAIYALVATSLGTVAALARLFTRVDAGRDEQVAVLRRSIHRDQAHWLHDDVCSELGYLRMRLDASPVDPGALRSAVDELDHRLRMRQIDEILDGGPARLGEIMQPFIRVAQTNGVELTDVPSFDTGAMLLPSTAGRQVQRALAVLTANAIHAGAGRIAIRTHVEEDGLVVEVEDDAGGFDVTTRIPGRGLDGLRDELGSDRLELVRTETGTLARVHIGLPRRAVPV